MTSAIPLNSYDDAITFAIHSNRPRLQSKRGPWTHRDEPDWHDPASVSKALNAAGCSNAAGFYAAVSLGTASRTEVLTVRNYVAHRGRNTALKVRTLCPDKAKMHTIDPMAVPLERGPGRPQPLLFDWIDDLSTMVSLVPV